MFTFSFNDSHCAWWQVILSHSWHHMKMYWQCSLSDVGNSAFASFINTQGRISSRLIMQTAGVYNTRRNTCAHTQTFKMPMWQILKDCSLWRIWGCFSVYWIKPLCLSFFLSLICLTHTQGPAGLKGGEGPQGPPGPFVSTCVTMETMQMVNRLTFPLLVKWHQANSGWGLVSRWRF